MISTIKKSPVVYVNEFKLQIQLEEPSDESKEIARKELRETPDIKNRALEELQKLLDVETDLLYPKGNEQWLLCFLRPCKFYPESAVGLIKRYYGYKRNNPAICSNLLPSSVKDIHNYNMITGLNNRDQLGRRIAVLSIGSQWKVSKVSSNELIKAVVLVLEALIMEPTSQIHGAVAIFDLEGFGLMHAMQFTPAKIKNLIDYIQDAAPMRLKAAHVVNSNKWFDLVFKVFKQLLNDKLADRIYFHGNDWQSLHNHINPEYLPPQYGGTAKNAYVESKHWYKLLLQFEEEYELKSLYGYKKNKAKK